MLEIERNVETIFALTLRTTVVPGTQTLGRQVRDILKVCLWKKDFFAQKEELRGWKNITDLGTSGASTYKWNFNTNPTVLHKTERKPSVQEESDSVWKIAPSLEAKHDMAFVEYCGKYKDIALPHGKSKNCQEKYVSKFASRNMFYAFKNYYIFFLFYS